MNERYDNSDPSVKIPEQPKLTRELQALLDAPRAEFVAAVKQRRKDDFEGLAALQLERINEFTGQDMATQITSHTDSVIKVLAQRAIKKSDAPYDWEEELAIAALGSYGRCELAPYSDIDIVLVHRSRSPKEWVRTVNQQFNTLLWDVGYQVGSSMRSLSELEHIIRDDFVTATAVLEQRCLMGSEALRLEMEAIRDRFRVKRTRAFLRYKVQERADRGNEVGASLFLMEPNLKTNPGCLRDVQLLRNIGFMLNGSRNLHSLRHITNIRWDDVQGIFGANDHLLRLRCLLHFKHGQRHDRCELADQIWLAQELGYASSSRMTGAEQMMRLHYQQILLVHQLTEVLVDRLHVLGYLGRRISLIKTRRKLVDDAVIVNDKVYLSHRDFWSQDHIPLRLMKIFQAAQARGVRIGLEFIRECKAEVANWHGDEDFRNDPDVVDVFMQIMSEFGRLRPILSDMHQSGLLGAFLPEFGGLTCLMQFNSYHHYTVDEHTLIAMGYLDNVWLGNDPGLPGMLDMLRQLSDDRDRACFSLALLLHDMGKFMGSGHVPRGALMVHPVAKRFGLSESEEDFVHFLVAEHVTLERRQP